MNADYVATLALEECQSIMKCMVLLQEKVLCFTREQDVKKFFSKKGLKNKNYVS